MAGNGGDSMIGKTLSHYRVVEKIGAGGMGEVYRATDTKLGRFVALKFLPEELSCDRQALERFLREARAAALLQFENTSSLSNAASNQERERRCQARVSVGRWPSPPW